VALSKKKRKSTDEKSLFVEKLPDDIPSEHIQLKKKRSNNDIFSGTSNECISDMLFNESLDSLGSGENDVFQSPNPYYFQLISPMDDFYLSSNNYFTNTTTNGVAHPLNSLKEDPSSIESNPNYGSPRNDAASPRLNAETNEFWNPETLGSTERETPLHHWTDDYVPMHMHENQMNWIV